MELLRLLPPYTVADVTGAFEERTREIQAEGAGGADALRTLQAACDLALDHARFQESRRTWLGTRVELYQQRQDLIAQIEQVGGECGVQPIDAYVYEYGEDFGQMLRRLVSVRLSGRLIADASLAWLRTANFALNEIRSLNLGSSCITDDGLYLLSVLTGLRCADLRDTGISANGVDALASLPELEWLHIGGTSVGALACRRLRKAHPRLTIATHADQSVPPFDGPEYEHSRLQRRLHELGMLPGA
jgi:hypothetical protein